MKLVLNNNEYNKMMGVISSISDEDIEEIAKNAPFLFKIERETKNVIIDIESEYVEAMYAEVGIWVEPILTAIKSLSGMIRLACKKITKEETNVILKLKEKYERENNKSKEETPSEAVNKIKKINLDKF